MKKLLSVILSFLIIFCFAFGAAGCGEESKDPSDSGNIGDDPSKEDPPEVDPPEDDPTDEELSKQEPVTGDKLSYRAVEEGGVTVGYSVSGFSGEGGRVVVIPAEHGSLPVTGIDGGAFDGKDVYYITLPASVCTIGENAFARCDKLRRVYISDLAGWCNIDFAGMASNPMYFASQLYLNGEPVSDLIIPDSVTRIPDFAFYECANLESVTVGRSVTEIGDSAFYNCEKLKKVIINGAIESMVALAFAHCEALEEVQIGNSVEEIGYYAFYECIALKEVTVPSSVKSIGESAFSMCVKLEKINFSEGLEYIGDCAFVGCYSLEEFIMPNSVTEIGFGILMFLGSYAFDGDVYVGANTVKKIVISDSLTVISQFAFSGCNIETITIGKGVETIDYSAFYCCSYLESVVLTKSVKSIISYAFYSCPLLKTVYYEGSAEELANVHISRTGNEIATATAYYYSDEQPAGGGKFWHYGADGAPKKW